MAMVSATMFFRRREYDRERELAGIMPCSHVAVVSGRFSSGSGSAGVTFEHHAIFDRDRDEYIHVTDDNDGEMRVVRTMRRQFERAYSSRPRVEKPPPEQSRSLPDSRECP